jgi:hypothetical protein
LNPLSCSAGKGRCPNKPSQRREEELPKWENQGRRLPYSRRPRKNKQNLLQIITEDRNHDTNCLVRGEGGEFIDSANCPSTGQFAQPINSLSSPQIKS